MANDRLFLRCTECEETQLLVKYYPSHSYLFKPDEMTDWLTDHLGAHGTMHDFGEKSGITLMTEDEWLAAGYRDPPR